jgi:hypothetical protein
MQLVLREQWTVTNSHGWWGSTVWKTVLLDYCFSKKVNNSGYINFFQVFPYEVWDFEFFLGKVTLRLQKHTTFFISKQQHF